VALMKTTPPVIRAVPPLGRAPSSRERLAFNFGPGTVPGKGVVDAALAADEAPTFATAPYAEPRDWGYIGLLAFTAVLMMRPQDQIPGLSSLHLAELCAAIGIAPMLLHRFARQLPVFRVTPETTGLILFGAAIIGTAPFSVWPGGAIQVFVDSYAKILIVFVLMMNTLTTPRRLEQITWLILLCSGYLCALAVVDYARGVNLVEGSRLAGPVSGMFGNPNDLALNMVTFLPAAIIIAMSRSQPALKRMTAAGIAFLMLATIVFTKSRSGAVGLAAALVVLVALGGRVRRGFAVAAIAAVLVAVPFVPASFWERMASITDSRRDATEFTGSREARRVVMQEGLATFADHPLTGVGAGQFKNFNPPGRRERFRETHNALIQVAAETGIIGLLAFTFLIVRAALATRITRRMLRPPRGHSADDPLRSVLADNDRRALYAQTVAMTAGLAGWFVCSLFASVAYNWTFYYLLALIVAGRELTRDRLVASRVIQGDRAKRFSVPAASRFRRVANGVA